MWYTFWIFQRAIKYVIIAQIEGASAHIITHTKMLYELN